MKAIIITSILLFCVNHPLVFAQSVDNEISEARNEYQNGLKQGKWFEYLDDIGLQVEEEGIADYFRLCNYTQGKLNGLSKLYAKADSSLISEIVFENDETNGFYKTYFPNRNLEEEMHFEKGKRTGTHKKYNEKGILILESVYENDKLNGAYKIYSDSGQIVHEVIYRDSRKHGTEKIYFGNARIRIERNYVNNELHGLEKQYSKHGNLRSERVYENGELHGIEREYYENGRLEREISFIHGELTEIIAEYYEDGSKKDPNRIEKYYWDNGLLAGEWPYVNNQLHGEVKAYYENGRLESVRPYVNDKLHGTVKEYYENGRLATESPYLNDKPHGIWKEYFLDGKKKMFIEQTEYWMGQEMRMPFSLEEKANLLKKLKADSLVYLDFDEELFKLRHKKTGKWGMYAGFDESPYTIVPMKYDSMYNFHDNYLLIWNNGKVGIGASPLGVHSLMIYPDKFYEIVPCIYEDGRIIGLRMELDNESNSIVLYFVARKNGKWGLVNWETGAVELDFKYNSEEDVFLAIRREDR